MSRTLERLRWRLARWIMTDEDADFYSRFLGIKKRADMLGDLCRAWLPTRMAFEQAASSDGTTFFVQKATVEQARVVLAALDKLQDIGYDCEELQPGDRVVHRDYPDLCGVVQIVTPRYLVIETDEGMTEGSPECWRRESDE